MRPAPSKPSRTVASGTAAARPGPLPAIVHFLTAGLLATTRAVAPGQSIDLSAIATGSDTSPGFVINGQASSDYSGGSVSSAGDVNGDGLADVIVGARYSDPAAGSNAGRSYVVFGKTTTAGVDLSGIAAAAGGGFVINGQAAGDRSGTSVSSAGDVNGDGLADLIVGAPYSSGRSYVVFSPSTPATTGSYLARVAAGNADRQGVGTHRFGDDDTIFPDSRAWVDFDGGTRAGVTATITRNDSGLAGLSGFATEGTADVHWYLSTTRLAWSACRVTVRYTDVEIDGLDEGALILYSGPTIAGPFTPMADFMLTPSRNEASGNVTSLPAVIVLLMVAPSLTPTPTPMPTSGPFGVTITRIDGNPTYDALPRWAVVFNRNVGASFTLSDVTLTGTLAGTSSRFALTGTDPTFVVQLLATTPPGTLGFELPAGSVFDFGGNPIPLTNAPLYEIRPEPPSGVAGDVNGDGVVNVADVTLLANFIVNGTPLP